MPTIRSRSARSLGAVALLALAVAACGGNAGSPTPATATKLVVGLGYIPSVQFAQFYYADQAGYYRDAGLEVDFQNKIDPELVTLIGQGAVDLGLADGTSVIPAVSQDIPIRYGFTVYADFPAVVFAKESSGIRTAADLKGKKIGYPGQYGSSWIQLQALLASAGLTPDDVILVPYPKYGQATALQQGVVDAATGFANNEPIQLEREGIPTVVLALPPSMPLPGNGIIAGTETLAAKGDALRAFVAATARAMNEITAEPAKGLAAAIVQVPELASDRDTQAAILAATIDEWQNDYTRAHGTGAIDPAAWQASIDFMRSLPDSPVARPVTVDECITDELLPKK
jgi:putative riboflavin transport system substrate-binding protein